MNLSFKMKLFLYFTLIILFTSLPIGYISYRFIYSSIKNNAFTSEKREILQIDNYITDIFTGVKEDTKLMSTNPEIIKADKSISPFFNSAKDSNKVFFNNSKGITKSIYNELRKYSTTHPNVAFTYLGTKWGGFVISPDELNISNYDPRKRSWYRQALSYPNEVIESSTPYTTSDKTNTAIISISTSVKDSKGNIVGVLGMDLSLLRLSKIIKSINIGKTGYLFILSKDGTLLAHPNSNLTFKNIKALSTTGVKAQSSNTLYKYSILDYNKVLQLNNSSFETLIDNKPVLMYVYTSPSTGIKMVAVIEKQEIMSQINKLTYTIVPLTLLIILLALLISIIASKRISKPIVEIKTLMKKAGNGDLTVKSFIKSKDEFGELSKGFNDMIEKLHSTNEELVNVYEELSITEEELRTQYNELAHNEELLRASEERYRLALDGANDAIWELDLKEGHLFTSSKFYDLTGYNTDIKINLDYLIVNYIYCDDVEAVESTLQNHLNNITPFYKSEFRLKIKNDTYIWVSCRGKALKDSNNTVIKLAGSISDISERKKSEEQLNFMAFYDSLTGIPNRDLFMYELNEHLLMCNEDDSKGALLFIDLDNFKYINDTLGHDFGNKLLKGLATKLRNTITVNDSICRFGGDEFLILHPLLNSENVLNYVKSLMELFNNSFDIDDKQIYITASVGISIYPKDGIEPSTILKNADTAMYKAKELGKNRFALYDINMYSQLERKTHIETILRNCIEKNELVIHYQPQYNIEENVLYGFESLLRLNSKDLGFISPAEFIPIAEETGSIVEIGKWVLRKSCLQCVEWKSKGYKFNKISVNVSSVQIHNSGFIDMVKEVLEETKLNPSDLELEITETVLMESLDHNIKILNKLRDIGIQIALDDFGTGYSSLGYLIKLPISTLKIDKSFIDNICTNRKEKELVKVIIELAHNMNLSVIAEGVETNNQLLTLKEFNCDTIQGYFFSKPLPCKDVENLFKSQ